MKKILLFAFISALVAAIASNVFLFVALKNNSNKNSSNIKSRLKTYKQAENEDLTYNILLLGYGGPGHPGGGLSDANVVAHINSSKKQVALITVPRDLWIQVPVRSDKKVGHKINAAFAIGNDDRNYPSKQSEYRKRHGGGRMAMDLFSQVTGLKFDYYIAIDFSRFKNAIDALSGISVDIPVSFKDEYFPIPGNENLLCEFSPAEVEELHQKYSGFQLEKQFKCRYETLEFNKGSTNMDGETALKFLRSRHSNTHGSDFARGERQQAVIKAIAFKLITLKAIENIDQFYDQFKFLITSDIGEQQLIDILPKIGRIDQYKISNINITDQNLLKSYRTKDGQSVLIPNKGVDDFSEIQDFIKENI